ncbi:MAG: tetratricopeptide repeat protein [Xanthomonadaceae bacterium]|nr:tetratricopeptide repeat protein [Xanthomonadaceae bacterium]
MSTTPSLPRISLTTEGPGNLILIEARAGIARDAWLRGLSLSDAPNCVVHHLDSRLRLGGPWAGLSDFLDALVPAIDAAAPELLERHRYELAMAVPSLRKRFPLTEASLTDASPVKERVRSYPVDRAYRLLHGLIDLLDEWLPRDGRRHVLVLHHIDETSALMRRFFNGLARRRLAGLPLDLILVASPDRATQVIEWLAPSEPQRIAADLPAEVDAPDLDALRAEIVELETRVNAAIGQADNLLPRLIDACEATGHHAQAQRWRATTLILFNHHGLYEDALYFGEPVLTDFDEIDQGERKFGRWNIVSGLFNAYAALGRAEDGLRVVRDEALTKITEPNDLVSIYYTLAMLHCRFLPQRDFALAEDYLQRAMDLLEKVTFSEAEKHYLAVFNLNGVAFIRFQQGRIDEAIALCREGFDRLERHLQDHQYRLHRSVLLYNIAQVYSAVRDYNEAIKYYTAAMEMDPRYSEYHNERGSMYLKLGRLDEAIHDFREAIGLSPPYFEVWTNLGQAYRRKGDYAAAVDAYSQAVDIEPTAPLARIGRAQAYEALERPDAALTDYDAALRSYPNDALLLSNRAALLFEAGRISESLRDLDEALRVSPEQADLYENRAIALAALERHDEAQRDRESALRLTGIAA